MDIGKVEKVGDRPIPVPDWQNQPIKEPEPVKEPVKVPEKVPA